MKLIVHIGAGKTGSSSIQAALEASKHALADRKIKYLGLMHEHGLGASEPSWRKHGGSPDFFLRAPRDEAIEQLKAVLLEEIRHPDHADLDALIWSNEWMFERADRIIPALQQVQGLGIKIGIIVYVREHHKWIASSYVQWGIKNKTYPGPVRIFSDWIKGRLFKVERILEPWLGAFGDQVRVFNFDATNDVVAHFFDKIHVSCNTSLRENVSPPSADLAAWAVFNNRYKEQVPENRFASFLRRLRRHNENAVAVPDLASLLPTEDDLKQQSDFYREDREFLNQLLIKSGEPEFGALGGITPPKVPSSWEMDRLTLEILFYIDARLSALEKKLQE